jgi:hypothetical protein
MEEVWKAIPLFKDYSASTHGRIKNNKTNRILKPCTNGKYLIVSLWNNSRFVGNRYIHRLVLYTFVGKSPFGFECAHLDGNSINNKLSNLKWCSPKENAYHKRMHKTFLFGESHQNSRFSEKEIILIIKMYLGGMSAKEISDTYRVSATFINHLFNSKKKMTYTYCPILKSAYKKRVRINKIKTAILNSPH